MFRIRIGDPDPSVFGPLGSASRSVIYLYGSGSFRQQAKKWRKTLTSTVLWLLYDFLSLKNVNVPSKRNKRKKLDKKKYFCWRLVEGHWLKEQDPDPLVTSTDPKIRIRTNLWRIPNTERIVIIRRSMLTLRVMSSLQEAKNLPCGSHLMAFTSLVCPCKRVNI